MGNIQAEAKIDATTDSGAPCLCLGVQGLAWFVEMRRDELDEMRRSQRGFPVGSVMALLVDWLADKGGSVEWPVGGRVRGCVPS